jgi:hypothetical protein
MAWKTARLRVAQVGPYDQLQPSTNADKLSVTVLCPQLTEQCLGFLEVGCIKALGEPTVDRCEALVRLSALALLLPQASQAPGRAQAVLSLGSVRAATSSTVTKTRFPFPSR